MDKVKIPEDIYEIDFSKIKCEISQRDISLFAINETEREYIYGLLDILDKTTQNMNSLKQQQLNIDSKMFIYETAIKKYCDFINNYDILYDIFSNNNESTRNALENLNIKFPIKQQNNKHMQLSCLSYQLYYKQYPIHNQLSKQNIIDLHKFLYIYTSQEFIVHPYEIICNFEDNLLILMNYMHPFYFKRFMQKIKADPKCQFVRKCSITYLLNLIQKNLANYLWKNIIKLFFDQNLSIFIKYMLFYGKFRLHKYSYGKTIYQKICCFTSDFFKNKSGGMNMENQNLNMMVNQLFVEIYRKQSMQLHFVKMLFTPIN